MGPEYTNGNAAMLHESSVNIVQIMYHKAEQIFLTFSVITISSFNS
jgi:hypothetical protein